MKVIILIQILILTLLLPVKSSGNLIDSLSPKFCRAWRYNPSGNCNFHWFIWKNNYVRGRRKKLKQSHKLELRCSLSNYGVIRARSVELHFLCDQLQKPPPLMAISQLSVNLNLTKSPTLVFPWILKNYLCNVSWREIQCCCQLYQEYEKSPNRCWVVGTVRLL